MLRRRKGERKVDRRGEFRGSWLLLVCALIGDGDVETMPPFACAVEKSESRCEGVVGRQERSDGGMKVKKREAGQMSACVVKGVREEEEEERKKNLIYGDGC